MAAGIPLERRKRMSPKGLPSGDGPKWTGWEEVTQAWEAAGQVAASMRMAWDDRDTAWRGGWRWR